MPILKYHPPIKKLLDKRKADGGYYEAECENCGTKFYPERSNAKYCSPNCGLVQHRMAVANGTAMKRGGEISKRNEQVEKQLKRNGATTLVGKTNVYNSLIEAGHSSFKGKKGKFLEWLSAMPTDEYPYDYEDIEIARLSPSKWTWKPISKRA